MLWATNLPTPASRAAASRYVGALGAEPVRLGEGSIEVLEVADARQRGRLMDDRVGLGGSNRLANRPGVERVEHDGLGSKRAQQFCLDG